MSISSSGWSFNGLACMADARRVRVYSHRLGPLAPVLESIIERRRGSSQSKQTEVYRDLSHDPNGLPVFDRGFEPPLRHSRKHVLV
jgi:hypothetical protein